MQTLLQRSLWRKNRFILFFWTPHRLRYLQRLRWLYVMPKINFRVDDLLSFLIFSIQLSLKKLIFHSRVANSTAELFKLFQRHSPQKNISLLRLHTVSRACAKLQQWNLSKIKTLFCVYLSFFHVSQLKQAFKQVTININHVKENVKLCILLTYQEILKFQLF